MALPVNVAVNVFEAGLMHVLMSVLGPVVVGVGVLVCDVLVLVLMCGVRMCVSQVAVLVFVCMRRVVGMLLGHGCRLLVRNMLCFQLISLTRRRFVLEHPGATMIRRLPSAHRRRGDDGEPRDRRARR